MILESLSLHDYGIYAGKHKISFSCDEGKPITLIGALNGSGKTTIIEAIQICLFGKNAKFIENYKGGYKAYLSDSINRKNITNSASVALKFSLVQSGNTTVYEVRRWWSVKGKSTVDGVQVFLNNEKECNNNLGERWPEFMDKILPSQLSDLFFFDGERIEFLAEPERCGKLIEKGVNALMGHDLIDNLQKTLAILKRRMLENDESEKVHKRSDNSQNGLIKKMKSNETLERIEAEENYRNKVKLLKNLDEEWKKVDDNLEELNGQFKEKNNEFESEGGLLHRDKDELEEKQEDKIGEIEESKKELIKYSEGLLPLALLIPELESLKKECANSLTPSEEGLIKDTLNSFVKTVNNEIKVNKKIDNASHAEIGQIQERVKKILCEDRRVRDFTVTYKEITLVLDEINNLKREAMRKRISHSHLQNELEEIKEKLLAVPEKAKIEEVESEVTGLQSQIDIQEKVLKELEGKRKEAEEEKKKAGEAQLAAQKKELLKESQDELQKSMINQLLSAKDKLKEFTQKIRVQHLQLLEKEIAVGLKNLFRKKDWVQSVKIDQSSRKGFNVALKLAGNEEINALKLSAGERQLLAVSVLWALAKKSRVSLPTVIDTPLGRLDSKHRRHFVENYFPYVSNQVILLSTDEEICGKYYDFLKKFIGKEYQVHYNEQSQSSEIKEGYFKNLMAAA